MPADDTQSSSWGSSQRPASHLRRSLAAAGRRSTRQTRLRTSEWMHQGGTMAHQQVHRSRWIACRRRSAAPSITISRLSRGKTVEKCTGSRPARNKKSPSRVIVASRGDRLQEFLAVDVFAFFGLAERDERDDGVIAVGRGARGSVGVAKDILFGCRGGNFAFRHFSQGQRKKSTHPPTRDARLGRR